MVTSKLLGSAMAMAAWFGLAATEGPGDPAMVEGPAWATNLPVYEVNLDVYGFERGTALREFERHLPSLRSLGVGVLWFMPLHPRGEKKGFGSPYSVRDYRAINPDLGTADDFRRLVRSAHALGLRVLMDWVPNHTSWDNRLIEDHPEFYIKDSRGEITQAFSWRDVAQLDYGQPGKWNLPLWERMRDDMVFWVREFGIDGYRCDVAGRSGKVPLEFWTWMRPQLNAVGPVLMLAEADDPYLHPAFDMTYSWDLPPVLWDVCAGRKPATAIDEVVQRDASAYPSGAVRMRFLDNHDWHDKGDWMWGDRPRLDTSGGMPQVGPLMVLCATLPGRPLLYNGQEMGFAKVRPPRQPEARTGSPVLDFYRRLLELYRQEPAVHRGSYTKLATNRDEAVFAFERRAGEKVVVVVVNLSGKRQQVRLPSQEVWGDYRDWFDGRLVDLREASEVVLSPWGHQVLVRDSTGL